MPVMMTLDLLMTLDVVDDDMTAVVQAYMADPEAGTVQFGVGYRIDPAAAVAAHPFARTLMDRPWADDALRRAAVRAAILLAEPERISVLLRPCCGLRHAGTGCRAGVTQVWRT